MTDEEIDLVRAKAIHRARASAHTSWEQAAPEWRRECIKIAEEIRLADAGAGIGHVPAGAMSTLLNVHTTNHGVGIVTFVSPRGYREEDYRPGELGDAWQAVQDALTRCIEAK